MTKRLAKLFVENAQEWEFRHKVHDDENAEILLDHNGEEIKAVYQFRNNGYDAGAIVGDPTSKPSLVPKKILTSPPIRGMTERLTPEGKIIALTSRDGLDEQSDETVKKGFVDDIARFAESRNQWKKLFEDDQ